jgi:hypothetical protein
LGPVEQAVIGNSGALRGRRRTRNQFLNLKIISFFRKSVEFRMKRKACLFIVRNIETGYLSALYEIISYQPAIGAS